MQKILIRFASRPTQYNNGFVRRVNNNVNNNNNNENDDNDDNNNDTNRQQDLYAGTLSKHPKNLYFLWNEYQFGLEGRKAARKFSIKERGRNRFTYNRRKYVWDKILELIRHGETNETAIDAIYETYGRDATVTTIINKLRAEKIEANRANLHGQG